jgi:hypothetical protein
MVLDCLVVTTKGFGINMFSFIHYITAKKRFEESKKTIDMMGGEDECQPMLLGQRDFLELEVDYYRTQMVKFGVVVLTLSILSVILYFYIN